MRRITAGLGAAVAAGLVITPSIAWAAGPVAATCGATLTSDAYLKKNLVCTGDALTLSGDITLDLRGHKLVARDGTAVTITGDGSPVVRRGSIVDSRTGIAFTDPETEEQLPTREVLVDRVTFKRNGQAISATGTSPFFFPGRITNVTVADSHFHRNDSAIAGVFTGRFAISGSSFTNNRTAVRIDTGNVSVTTSYFGNNEEALACVESGCSLTSSRLENNPTGVSVGTASLTLTDVSVTGSATGVSVSVGGITAKRNRFSGNETAVSLLFVGGTMTDNRFTRNGTGFTAEDLDDGSGAGLTLVGNRFFRNTDGIYVEGPGLSLQDNRAVRNTRYGIYAPQATDLGGNSASGNGAEPQCTGVAC